ncbi:MAG: hypothetical protein DBY32_09050 [Phascolarctobacterium sp.]|nr:MAG: hypothetical protein DBY32_09050 [Phascolarctobacterium sp.]
MGKGCDKQTIYYACSALCVNRLFNRVASGHICWLRSCLFFAGLRLSGKRANLLRLAKGRRSRRASALKYR